MSKYKICLVPTCPNTRTNSPDKEFIYVSDDLKSRWCAENNFEYPKYSFCCEDHLDLKEDLINYRIWKLTNAKPLLKSNANLVLSHHTSDILVGAAKLSDPHRNIYVKKCDSKQNPKPLESPVKSENTVNVSLQCKVQTVERSTHKAQKARRYFKMPRASPGRPHRQLAENPESTSLPSGQSNQTFIISPLASHNSTSIHIQCKAETEDQGTTCKTTCEQSDRPLATADNSDASLQCTLITADDSTTKPRKSRFSQWGSKRYDLVQDKRKIKLDSLTNKNDFYGPVQTKQSTLLSADQTTSGTQKSRFSRSINKKDLSQDQGKDATPPIVETRRTPKKTTTISLQTKSRLPPPEIHKTQTEKETKRPSTAKSANVSRPTFRNAIVCETQKHRVSRSNVSNEPGQQQNRRSSKNTAHASLQVDSRKSLVRSLVVSRAKGMVMSPCNRIVIHVPKSNHNIPNLIAKSFIHSAESDEM